jgi:hypothetical protein
MLPECAILWAGLRGLVPALETFARAAGRLLARSCVVPGADHCWRSVPIDEPGSHVGVFAPQLDFH